MDLHNKVVVITGGARGIGHALTQSFLKQGAIVWALDIQEKALSNLFTSSKKEGHTVSCENVDVTNEKSVLEVMKKILNQNKRIDIWVNNAGIAIKEDFLNTKKEKIKELFNINTLSVILNTQTILSQMEKQGKGTLVNMASVSGHVPAPFLSLYTASKHAIVGFTRALESELRFKDSAIKTLLVSPGFVNTSMISLGEKMGFPNWLSFLLCKPEDVAKDVLKALKSGKKEVFSGISSNLILKAYRLSPFFTLQSSRMLLAPTFKDFLLNRLSVR